MLPTSMRLASLAFACAIFAAPATAFPPSVWIGAISPGESHAAITKTALSTVYEELSISDVSSSMSQARKVIVDANADIDSVHATDSGFHCDGENFPDCQANILKGVDDAVLALRANRLDEARKAFGGALHILQDFYTHSNWIELGNPGLHPQLGKPGLTITGVSPNIIDGGLVDEPTCLDTPTVGWCAVNNLTTTLLTSGYFHGQGRNRPAGKCRHGGWFDNTPGRGGINKDMSICTGTAGPGLFDAPHSEFHPQAADLAARATVQLLHQLRDRVTPRQYLSFLGIGAPFAFAIDTTGSMGSVIDGVKATVNQIIDSRVGTIEEASQYVLAPFGDPDVPAAVVTEDPARFRSALAGLFADGGGDCPELSMTGLYNAVAAADSRAQVYLFTDASAKDSSRYWSAQDLATAKRSKVFFALFGSCSPYDPAYLAIARNTGGQVFALQYSEAAQVARLTDLFSRTDTVDILSVWDTLSATPKTYAFPVDSHVRRLNVSVATMGSNTVVLKRPDGTTVVAGTPGVTRIPLSTSTALAIDAPQQGTWQITASGSDTFSILVNGASSLSFSDFSFVEEKGRPGHSGAFPIAGSPGPGQTLQAMATLGAAATTRSYEFRRPDNTLLSRFTLESTVPTDTTIQIGAVQVPDGPFVAYAVGVDDAGAEYQRVVANVFNPQTVMVTAPSAVGLPQGQTTTYIFSVKNEGSADNFNFDALDDRGYVLSVTPASAALATGASTTVAVAVRPPVTAPIGSVQTLTFNAQSAADAAARNFATLSSVVTAPVITGDVNRDGRVDCDDLGLVRVSFGSTPAAGAFNPNVDLDANGIVNARDLAVVGRAVPAGTICR